METTKYTALSDGVEFYILFYLKKNTCLIFSTIKKKPDTPLVYQAYHFNLMCMAIMQVA